MHIQPGVEGVQQRVVAAQVGHDAQLDLGVVGAGNHAACGGHKGLAHAAAFGGADGDVLQVGVVAGQAACDGHGLRVVRVHAAGAWQGQLGELVGVGAFELDQAAVLQQLGGQGVVLGQLFQHLFVGAAGAGGGLLDHGHAQLVEEDFAQLLGAAQVEGLACNLVCLGFELQDALAQFVALCGERGCVNQHAVAFDAVQGLTARDFQLVDEAQFVIRLQQGPQGVVHVQRLVGVFARVSGGLVHRHLRKRDLVRAFAAQVFVGDALAARVALGQAGQVVGLVHFEHVALQHGVVRVALHLNAVVGEHMAVVLDVLAQLGVLGVFQPGLEAGEHFIQRQLRGRVGAFVA